MSRPYALIDIPRTVSTANTVLQLTAPSTMNLEILRVWIEQSSSTTSAMADAALVRKTATVTGGTSITPSKLVPGDPAATTTAVRTATGEGTETDTLAAESFNILNGWLWIPTPDERPWVAPSGMVALRFTAAPTSATYRYGITFLEHG